MGETYRAVMLTKKGGPEVLEVVALPRVAPGAGEVRVTVRATGAGGTDITMRRGTYPYAPKLPFVPGYEAVGVVESLGDGVTSLRVGQRVAALLVHGGYAEELVRPASEFVSVPDGLDDGEVVALILNYVTAWQAIHRCAEVTAGMTALVNGANGGVGTALVELLRLAGAHVYAAASAKHHDAVRALGAIAIEGRARPVDEALRAVLPEGVDVSFDGLGGAHTGACRRATRRGGVVVGYGFSGTMRDGRSSTLAVAQGFVSLMLGSPLTGRRGRFYGITQRYRDDPTSFREDLPKLFALLAEKKIAPRIAARLPLLAAREAQERLERGGVEGKIVHLAGV